MTTTTDVGHAAPGPPPSPMPATTRGDHRGSWIPSWGMIATRLMELRKRRGLMIALAVVYIGIPAVFLVVRLISHAVAPHSYGPAGGYSIFTLLVTGFMYTFGFIVAATVGCTAGSVDLTEGMFRHLVITGRSRLALYFARIPAGLAIVISMVAVGYTIVCAVCVFAAPTQLNYDGVNVPQGLSRSALDTWAAEHATEVVCNFNFDFHGQPPPGLINAPCPNNGPGPGAKFIGPGGVAPPVATPAQVRAAAIQVANQDYATYRANFLVPSYSLMIDTGLWISLVAVVGFVVGLGLSSLMGQRTVPVIILLIWEVILTPALSFHLISHLLNVQRGIVGLALGHVEPGSLPLVFGPGGDGGGGGQHLLPESTLVASLVIVGWLVFWTAMGAWRMRTRDT